MTRWIRWLPLALLALACTPGEPGAATWHGRSVDDVWYEGHAVSTTYGAYRCQMKFHGDRVFIRLASAGIEVVGVLDDEIILDEHEIVAHDPKRGGDWVLDCANIGR